MKYIPISSWNQWAQDEAMISIDNPDGVIIFNNNEFNYIDIGPWGFERLVDYVNQKDIPLYIVNGACREHGLLHNQTLDRYRNVQPIIYWESFFPRKSYDQFKEWIENFDTDYDVSNPDTGLNLKDFEHVFISMNHRPHFHRCSLLDHISKHNLFDVGAVSFTFGDNHYQKIGFEAASNFYKFQYWKPEKLILDNLDFETRHPNNSIPEHYKKSFMQVVSESSHMDPIISEKTVAPLVFNKPFLVSGPRNFHSILERFGFQLYDELFSYDFDTIRDINDRNDELLKNVVQYRNHPKDILQILYEAVIPKLRHNRSVLIDLISNENHLPDFIKELRDTNNPALDVDIIMKRIVYNWSTL